MKKISLIRHAQSVANAWLPTSDPATVMLTDLWREQARLLAANRTDEIDLILYSQYTRTQETAKPMIEKFPQVTVLQNPFIHEFTYLDPKQCINTTGDQRRFLRERFWMNDDVFYQDGASAESVHQLLMRVRLFIDYVSELPHNHIVAFSHWQYIRMLVAVLQNPNKEYAKNDVYRILYETEDVHNCWIVTMELNTTLS